MTVPQAVSRRPAVVEAGWPRRVVAAAGAVPLFLVTPLLRPWHLRWGARDAEVRGPMPGDDLVPVSHFTATRALTVHAPPRAVWPWLMQVGFRRAGFYSYDLLDNVGRQSATRVLPDWQGLREGDVIAPMTDPPTTDTAFVIAEIDPPRTLVWAKPDSTWSWSLRELPQGSTRVVTRLKQRYRRTPTAIITVVLMEFFDFAMMRRMLLGIKERAESDPS